MAFFEISVVVGLALGGFLFAYLLWFVAGLRRRRAAVPAEAAAGETPAGDFAQRLIERRLDALETAQAELDGRLEAQVAAGPARLGEIAGPLAQVIRDKNASLETALAGIEALRVRLKTLEELGDLAEARGLLERVEARLDAAETARAAAEARAEGRLGALEANVGPGIGEVASHLGALIARKDEALEAALGRGDVEMRERLAALEARMAGSDAAAAERLAEFHLQHEAMREALLGRLAPLEAGLADMHAALRAEVAMLAVRVVEPEALENRLAPLEAGLKNTRAALQGEIAALAARSVGPEAVAALDERLTVLDAAKDAALDETRAMLRAEIAARNPAEALGDLDRRLGAVQTALQGEIAALATRSVDPEALEGRLAPLEAGLKNTRAALRGEIEALAARAVGPEAVAALGEQMAALDAEKNAALERVVARLTPLEAGLEETRTTLRAEIAAQDPAAALGRIGEAQAALWSEIEVLGARTVGPEALAMLDERLTEIDAAKDKALEEVRTALRAEVAALAARAVGPEAVATLEERLAEIDAAKDAALEEARATLRAEIAAQDPAAALGDLDRRLGEVQTALQGEIAALAGRSVEPEALETRLAPLEAGLGEIRAGIAAQDPAAALGELERRLGEVQAALWGEIEGLAARAVGPEALATLGERLTALDAEKDAAIGQVAGRLAGLDAEKDAAFERVALLDERLAKLGAEIAAQDPFPAIETLDRRLEAAQEALRGEIGTFGAASAASADQLAAEAAWLRECMETTLEQVVARLAPIEARLDAMEAESLDEDEARAEAQAIAAQLAAARVVAEQTELFSSRLALLEASLPQLPVGRPWARGEAERAGPLPDRAPEPQGPAPAVKNDGQDLAASADLDEVWQMPRVVSLHHG